MKEKAEREDKKKRSRRKERRKAPTEASRSFCENGTEQNHLPIPREETGAARTDADTPLGFFLPSPSQEKTGAARERRRAIFCGTILSVSLAVALGILFFVALTESPYGAAEDTAASNTDLTDAMEEQPSEKIVFVRQYDTNAGALSTPELYALCAPSAVSVVVSNATSSGVGSGFILTSNGYIATANHVIEGMEKVTVVMADGTRYAARAIAGNALTDLALLKIDAEGLPAVTFGKSGELLTGERVVAIGTPAAAEYAGSLCSGEISFAQRQVVIYEDGTGVPKKKLWLIQTDALVNHGNSGCPLFDEYGRVVGMITMKLGDRYAGIGFAIPIDGARAILEAMMRGEELTDGLLASVGVPAPRLGVTGEAAQLDGVWGVRVLGFASNESSAARTLRVGDMILQIDDTAITSFSDIREAILKKNPSDSVAVTVLRGAQRLTFEVVLEK